MRIAAFLLSSIALAALAVDSTRWPPKDAAAMRMRELQLVIGSPESTAAQREAAREELSALLKSPNAKGRTPDEKPVHAAPRAAIEPIGPMVRPAVNPPVPMPGVATVDVTIPPRITIAPKTGTAVAPTGSAAIDPRTGHVLHETGNGYVDPRTGQFIPK
jgi:hypothetical protein